MRPLASTLAALALACAAALARLRPGAPQSSPFTDAEREALHAEIRAYLLANPELLIEMIAAPRGRSSRPPPPRATRPSSPPTPPAIFDDGFSFVGGNPDGSLTVVEFLDYQCGFCRQAQPERDASSSPATATSASIVKEMPILGPGSDLAARAAVATLITEGPETYADAARPADGACTARSPTRASTRR